MMGLVVILMFIVFSKKIDILLFWVELFDVIEKKGIDCIFDDEMLVKVFFNLKVGELIDFSIMQFYLLIFVKDLILSFMNIGNVEEEIMLQFDVIYEQLKEFVMLELCIELQQ